MKETILSTCERDFLNKSIEEGTRLDGRQLLEARPAKIYFGSNWGCCLVSLGQTKVAAQVSCDIEQPKASRPNEGMLYINVELNPIAAQHFEGGRQSDAATLINRQLEKCIKDSKCIDLESLCIVADKQVWNIRIDINVINHDGNLVDCASIAALAALAHFHRPDVTSTGENVIIHPFTEKDPLPLTLHHYPVCVSFLTYESGKTIMDPTYTEERVGVAQLTLGINSYNEICSLDFNYLTKTLTVQDVISEVSNHAAKYASKLIQQIKNIVAQDVQARYNKNSSNTNRFNESIATKRVTSMYNDSIHIKLRKWGKLEKMDIDEVCAENLDSQDCKIVQAGPGSAELVLNEGPSIGEGGPSTWEVSESEDEEDDSIKQTSCGRSPNASNSKANDIIDLSGDSEEEVTELLQKKRFNVIRITKVNNENIV